MTHLEIKHLRMIRMIARTGSVTKASQKLFISQPALSQQLKDIEAKLGAELFLRTGKYMVLTRVGQRLLNRADTIIDEINQAELEVANAVNGEKGELKIGVRCMFSYAWLPDAIRLFQEKYPHVDLEVSNSLQPDKDLLSKVFDVVILAAPVIHHQLSSVFLFEDEIVCAMSIAHPLSRRKFLELEDLHGTDIISMVDRTRSSYYDAVFEGDKIKFKRYMTIGHAEAVVALVEADLGISILPKWFISPYTLTKKIHTCQLSAEGTKLQWSACFFKDKHAPSYQEDFLTMIASRPD